MTQDQNDRPRNDSNGDTKKNIVDLRIEFAKMQTEFQGITARELSRLAVAVDKLRVAQEEIRIDLARLRTELNLKAGIWGMIAGMVPAVVVVIWMLAKKMGGSP